MSLKCNKNSFTNKKNGSILKEERIFMTNPFNPASAKVPTFAHTLGEGVATIYFANPGDSLSEQANRIAALHSARQFFSLIVNEPDMENKDLRPRTLDDEADFKEGLGAMAQRYIEDMALEGETVTSEVEKLLGKNPDLWLFRFLGEEPQRRGILSKMAEAIDVHEEVAAGDRLSAFLERAGENDEAVSRFRQAVSAPLCPDAIERRETQVRAADTAPKYFSNL